MLDVKSLFFLPIYHTLVQVVFIIFCFSNSTARELQCFKTMTNWQTKNLWQMMILICVLFALVFKVSLYSKRFFMPIFLYMYQIVFYLCLVDGCSINLSHYLSHIGLVTDVLKISLEDYQILYHFFRTHF